MARGIKRGAIPHRIGNIPPFEPPTDEVPLRFSFKHLDLTNPKFCTERCQQGYLLRFLGRLRDVCTISVREFKTNRSRSLKAHPLDFSRSSETDGFAHLNEQLREEEAWQFEVTRNEHGRVHGLLIQDTFYIVWIDPDHLLLGNR